MRRNPYIVAVAVTLIASSVALTATLIGAATNVAKLYNCVKLADQTKRIAATATTTCPAGYVLVSWDVTEVNPATTTTLATTTTSSGSTTTQPTTTTGATTTTTQPAGSFLSYPPQSGRQSFSGTNVVVSNRSYVGLSGGVCLTVSNATNVYLHDLDFDGCVGAIFLINVSGNIRIENVRARNTGDGTIGSGHSNVIQLNNSWQGSPNTTTTAGIRNIKAYGGDTEDIISIYKSGGLDASHALLIEDVHLESPLPPDSLAWSSGSGTCINLADGGGHDIALRSSTFLNCGQVGIQMNQPTRVTVTGNVVYGAQRTNNNVGLSQYGTCTCSGDVMSSNRAWWKNASGGNNPRYIQHSEYFTTLSPTPQPMDTTINPASLRVVL